MANRGIKTKRFWSAIARDEAWKRIRPMSSGEVRSLAAPIRSFFPPANPRRHNNAAKRSFTDTFSALVSVLKESLSDPAKRIIDVTALPDRSGSKLRLPSVNDYGLRVSDVKGLVESHLGLGRKPFWITRHHSGGFSTYLAFFPSVFKLNRGGATPSTSISTKETCDVDRLTFFDQEQIRKPVNIDVDRIFDDFERSGFDPPLAIAQNLPFNLIPCNLPSNFEIVYGHNEVICNDFIKNKLFRGNKFMTSPNNIVVGLDTETTQQMFTKQQFKQPCLIQLSTDSSCLLVHAAVMGKLPGSVKEVLSSKQVKKVVVGAPGDLAALRLFGISPENFVDVSSMQKKGSSGMGLGSMAAKYLGLKVAKPRVIQVGDWKKTLTKSQMIYAATDAWISLLLYRVLKTPERGSDDVAEWWNDNSAVLRRFSKLSMDLDLERRLLEDGFRKIEGSGERGEAEIFSETLEKRVDPEFLKSLYSVV
ncbi:hypothetical protein HDU83_008067 [Entophlyctis luteolus]|nr:hypothetical protein HDU83_008067 [Entophlyctis luteolus]